MLAPISYLTVNSIINEVPTQGHSPLRVTVEENTSIYFIKNNRGRIPDYYIINEFLCHFLLKIWRIPTPDIAAIKVDSILLNKDLSHFHKNHYYETIAFGSKEIKGSVEISKLLSSIKSSKIKQLGNSIDFIKIGLFDIWVENTDRKPSNFNLLISNEDDVMIFIAIDHAFAFDSMKYSDLFLGVTNTFDQSILSTDLAKRIVKSFGSKKQLISTMKEYFYFCLANCQQNFLNIVNNIPTEIGFSELLQSQVYDFIFNEERNKLVFEEFVKRLK